jgi:ketol-acid reductoisomerase
MMRLTIIGFGNQALAWGLNLRDSNFPVRVALRGKNTSFEVVTSYGLEAVEIGSADFFQDQIYALLIPDQSHVDFLKSHGENFRPGTTILYAHGYSILKHQFELLYPQINHVLFAPKAIGTELRKQYQLRGQLGAVYSTEHYQGESALLGQWMMNFSKALGINLGPYRTTIKNETEADLYSEQGLLCSLIPYAASEMFRGLTEKGIEPELAYFECWHELKLIVNAMVDVGPKGFFDLISPNALIGSEKGFQKLFTNTFQNNLNSLLSEIQDGSFNKEIDEANIDEIRSRIINRWKKSPLQMTFEKMKQENP